MYDPVVTDRDSVCIFSQIVDYGLCTLKSFFAVRDPFYINNKENVENKRKYL